MDSKVLNLSPLDILYAMRTKFLGVRNFGWQNILPNKDGDQMTELAYSLHLSSDKNRKNISKQNSKNNISGSPFNSPLRSPQ